MGVMELLQPTRLARKVLATPRSTVPYPLLRENTLVLSDQLVLRRRHGRLELQVRVGDVYPNQVRTSIRRASSLWRMVMSLYKPADNGSLFQISRSET